MNYKSIKWKIGLMFALCIATVLTVVCVYQTVSVIYGEKQEFEDSVKSVFTDEYIAELSGIAQSVQYTVDSGEDTGELTVNMVDSNNIAKIYDSVWAYAAELGIGRSRYMCILDKSGAPMYSTGRIVMEEGVEKTSSVIAALNGNAGISTSLLQIYCDYALPVGTSSEVVYIRDNGDELYRKVKDTLFVYLYSMIFAFIFSFFAGIYLAGSVTGPLKRMTEWAKQLAAGNTGIKADIPGNDELSALSKTLTEMAYNLDAASDEVRQEKTKLETILQTMSDGLLTFDTEGNLIHHNEEAKRLLGRNFVDDIIFDSFFKEINVNITIGDLIYMDSDTDTERHVTIDKDRYIVMNFKTFKLNGKVAGIVVVLHDMTKQEKLEQSRRGFVADVSHELRTPITTIKSYAETLIDSTEEHNDLTRRFLGVIASESDRMARLISDLLTLSSLDDKHTTYKMPEEIDIRKMLVAITERFQISAGKKNQILEYNPINDIPTIIGDPDALERIFINIIGNAVKYTPDGGKIEVYSSKVYNDICVKVSDNGIGISEENLPHIFDRFYRVDKARSRDTGGTGLGLAIAKQTIETSFKGKIKISSEVGKGTEVSITIPVSSS